MVAKTPKLNKTLRFAVYLGRFASNNGLDILDAAELVALAKRAHRAGERDCNEPSEASDRAYEKTHEDFKIKAESLGFDVQWSGLWPTLKKNGECVNLPSEC